MADNNINENIYLRINFSNDQVKMNSTNKNDINMDSNFCPEKDCGSDLGAPPQYLVEDGDITEKNKGLRWNKIYADEIKGRVTFGAHPMCPLGIMASAEGYQNWPSGNYSHAEGFQTMSAGPFSHSEGGLLGYAPGKYDGVNWLKLKYLGPVKRVNEQDVLLDPNDYNGNEVYGYKYELNSTYSGIHVGDYLGCYSESMETTYLHYDFSGSDSENQTTTNEKNNDPRFYVVSNFAALEWTSRSQVIETNNNKYIYCDGDHIGTSGLNPGEDGQRFFIYRPTKAMGFGSHAEGCGAATESKSALSHAEGFLTTTSGFAAHVEGYASLASGEYSHAEGCGSEAIGACSHAENGGTASGAYSHASGQSTKAARLDQFVFGSNNEADNSGETKTDGNSWRYVNIKPNDERLSWSRGKYIEIVGNGGLEPSNARTLDWLGNQWIKGTYSSAASSSDYAERRQMTASFKPGQVVQENGDGTLSLTTKRLARGCEIISDTYGCIIGREDIENNLPIAASGRVLAYPDKDPSTFEIGAPVCAGENGTISQMTEEEERLYPSRILGVVSEIPTYEQWGEYSNKVKVDGRIWIRVR